MPCFSIQKNSCLFVEGNNKTCYINSKENDFSCLFYSIDFEIDSMFAIKLLNMNLAYSADLGIFSRIKLSYRGSTVNSTNELLLKL